MAKDPAFLFYPGDYIGGTMGMTFEEKGAYVDLLMLQFNRGHMTSHMIGQVVGHLWDTIKVKFVQDANGLWYNERLELEQNLRKQFTSSRKNNLKGNNQHNKNGRKTSHMTSHMEDEDINENKDDNINKNVVQEMFSTFKKHNPNYSPWKDADYPALREIAAFICKQEGISFQPMEKDCSGKVLEVWSVISQYIPTDTFYQDFSLKSIKTNIQTITSKIKNGTGTSKKPNGSAKITSTALNEVFTKRRGEGTTTTYSNHS